MKYTANQLNKNKIINFLSTMKTLVKYFTGILWFKILSNIDIAQ